MLRVPTSPRAKGGRPAEGIGNGRAVAILLAQAGARVVVADQLSRVFNVGEHDGDLLAFAFKGAAGGEDFLGQVLGRIGRRVVFLALRR